VVERAIALAISLLEACVNAWHRRFSEWTRADSYLPAIAMVATSVTLSSEISRIPQIPALCVLEFRSTGLLGTGTSALLGRHALPRRAPSRTVLRRTEREEASMRWTGRFIGFVIPAPSADAVTLDDRPAQRIAVYRF
jgi:hypothetical protein